MRNTFLFSGGGILEEEKTNAGNKKGLLGTMPQHCESGGTGAESAGREEGSLRVGSPNRVGIGREGSHSGGLDVEGGQCDPDLDPK